MVSLELQGRDPTRDREPGDLGAFQAVGGDPMEQGVRDVTLEPAGSGGVAIPLPPPLLLPPPPDVGALLRLAAWLALLGAGYGIQRGLCAAGLPYDCDGMDAAEAFSCVTLLALLGGALAWLVGATQPARFAWLVGPRRAYLWAVYIAVFPAYSALSNIPALQASLASKSVSPAFLAVNVAVGVVGLAALAFHVWLAVQPPLHSSMHSSSSNTSSWQVPVAPNVAADGNESGGSPHWAIYAGLDGQQAATGSRGQLLQPEGGSGGGGTAANHHSSGSGKPGSRVAPAWRWRQRRRALALYLLPRLVVLGFFAAWLAALPLSGAYSLHLHHYALGWAVAGFAAFNHPVSGLLLAFGTAVFVQGGAAYGFDALFKATAAPPGGCLPVSSNSTGQMTCAFWAAEPFHLSFCSNTSWIPWFTCNVPWPWPETDLSRIAAMAVRGASAVPAAGAPAPLALAPAPSPEPPL